MHKHFRFSAFARNAEPLATLAPQFEAELKRDNSDENCLERVRIAVQQKCTGRRPSIEAIADALPISCRTLERRLQDERSSFQRILDQVCHSGSLPSQEFVSRVDGNCLSSWLRGRQLTGSRVPHLEEVRGPGGANRNVPWQHRNWPLDS